MSTLKIKTFIFKYVSGLARHIFLFLKLRPASLPYISGDGFRSIAQHIYEAGKTFNPDDVAHGDIVFLEADKVHDYFKHIHPKINAKYKLISHNSDQEIGELEASYIDGKIIRWFAQNTIVDHPKITPIPIGIENIKWFMSGFWIYILAPGLQRAQVKKKFRMLFGFSVKTNPKERTEALENLRLCKSADEIVHRVTQDDYVRLLNQYHFVASPPGNGTDCIRTWEALLLGSIPVCKESVLINYFVSLGVPIVTLKHWNEILDWNEETLETLHLKHKEALHNKYILMDAWIELIRNTHE